MSKLDNFKRVFSKNFLLLFVGYTLICMAHIMIQNTIGAYQNMIGMEASVIGLISSAMSMTAFIIRPFSAVITDRGNKKRIYLIALLIFVAALVLYSVVTTPSGMVVAKVLHGIAWTFISTIVGVILSEYVSKSDYGTALGFFLISQMVASAFAPGIGFAVAEVLNYQVTYMIFAGVAAVGLVICALIPPTKKGNDGDNPPVRNKISFKNFIAPEAFIPALINLVFQGTVSGIGVFLAIFAKDEIGLLNIGLYFTCSSVTAWVARPFLGTLLDKKGAMAALFPAGLSFTAGLIVLGLSQNLAMMCLAGVLVGFGQTGISPVTQAISLRSVPADRKTVANATNYLGMDLGSAIAATLTGFLIPLLGYRLSFMFYAAPVLLITIVAALYLKKAVAQPEL